jgi:hypothetical protein
VFILIQAIIHRNMEMSHGNSLHNYLKQIKMSLFSFRKSEDRRAEQVLSGGWYWWGGRGEKGMGGEYGADAVHTWMQMENRKLLKLFQERGNKGEWWRG